MTASNLIVQRDAAHLLTDGCLYDDDGTIRALCSKSIVSARFRMALVPSGRCSAGELADALNRHAIVTQAGFMAALPKVAAEIKAEHMRGQPTWDNDLQLFVAIWNERTDRPEAWALSTSPAYFGSGYPTGTLAEVDQLIAPNVDLGAIQARQINYADPASFDAARDGLAILEAQRAQPWDDGVYFVGGHAQLCTVTRTGVEQRVLRHWPDRIGEKIQP